MKIKKTVTEKTIAANGANASKSPGPKTDVGKRRARMNSLKHGFFAKELQIAEEDRPEFERLQGGLLQQFAPATPMQQIGFEKIILRAAVSIACSITGIWLLIGFEVDQFRRLRFLSRQFLLHLLSEVLLRQRASFVQPGCTIEVLPVPARELASSSPFLHPTSFSSRLACGGRCS